MAADLTNRSHRITAQVELTNGDDAGVLLAHGGGGYGGYSLYVKDRRLHYVHSYCGVDEQHVRSEIEMPSGATRLAVEFTKTGEHRGTALLLIDGRNAGQAEITRTMPTMFGKIGEGLCCGYDSGASVTADYRAPFPYWGRIREVVVEIVTDAD